MQNDPPDGPADPPDPRPIRSAYLSLIEGSGLPRVVVGRGGSVLAISDGLLNALDLERAAALEGGFAALLSPETAAEALAGEGIEAEVIDLRSLRPMDTETVVRSVQKTNRCVTVEEGWPVCSIGNHISAVLMQEAFDWLDAPVINCTGKDVPMPYAANLEKLALVTTEEVVAACKAVTYR